MASYPGQCYQQTTSTKSLILVSTNIHHGWDQLYLAVQSSPKSSRDQIIFRYDLNYGEFDMTEYRKLTQKSYYKNLDDSEVKKTILWLRNIEKISINYVNNLNHHTQIFVWIVCICLPVISCLVLIPFILFLRRKLIECKLSKREKSIKDWIGIVNDTAFDDSEWFWEVGKMGAWIECTKKTGNLISDEIRDKYQIKLSINNIVNKNLFKNMKDKVYDEEDQRFYKNKVVPIGKRQLKLDMGGSFNKSMDPSCQQLETNQKI